MMVFGPTILLAQQDDTTQTTHPRLPPGQWITSGFPVTTIGDVPEIDTLTWTLTITGDVENIQKYDWNDFTKIKSVESTSDFHCITSWSKLDIHWIGVRIRDILASAIPKSNANFVTFLGDDGYTTSLTLEECTGDDDILAYRWNGEYLAVKDGGPVRAVIPKKYGYKSAMWLVEMRLTEKREKGYWEQRGYDDEADPWSRGKKKNK